MRIAIDAMGGDHAPEAIIKGALDAASVDPSMELLLVGLEDTLQGRNFPANIKTVFCGSVMSMDEDVRSLMRKRDSSIWVATQLVKDGEADAVVSAGSTAAQMAAATLLLSRLKGVERPGLGLVVPTIRGGRLLLDAGANAECTPQMLLQFAELGAVYAEQLLDIENPKIGLLSNGTEAHKGNSIIQQAYTLLQASGLNFIGNIEARDIPAGVADVAVADGFTGNVILKLTEGLGSMFSKKIKDMFMEGLGGKLSAVMMMGKIKDFKKSMDYTEYGGAPLLGVMKPVIKAHGSSNPKAFKNAIRQARDFAERNLIGEIEAAVQQMKNAGEE